MALPKYKYSKVIEYWKSKEINTIEKANNILDNFSILFAYNSGTIENKEITYHDTREIFVNGKVINFTGNLRTLYEIENQKKCYYYVIPKVIDKVPLSEELIKEIHKTLTKGTYDERRYEINKERAGEYKKHDYVTGKNEVGTNKENVQKEVLELLEEINHVSNPTDEEVIKIAAYTHNVIEQIHPFADGNGRLGRTLANYILMFYNLPPIIIYDEDKKYYYAALEKFDEKDDLSSMVEFLKYEMEKTWEKALDREYNVSKLPNKLSDYINNDNNIG